MSDSAKAVFLSYSAEDVEAARRICDALRDAGITVWFDQSELRGGDAWDASIRQNIAQCALFMPIISAGTEARSEGYFRLEWRLAVERSRRMADDQTFLIPVVIDGTEKPPARVPDRFLERQWSHLEGGKASPAFVAHVARLLEKMAAGEPDAVPSASVSPSRSADRVSAPRGSQRLGGPRRLAFAVIAAVVVIVIGAVTLVLLRADRHLPAGPGATPSGPAIRLADRKSIAVLPFANLSGRAEDSYLADGLQEEILNALARVGSLKVISRTSVMEYRDSKRNLREIGTRLGVASILEGSIRRDGNTLRLTVQLIDAHDDHHLLAANYDRDLSHILDLQSAVAKQVADALAATLSQYDRGQLDRIATNSGDAYDRYLRAVSSLRQPVAGDADGLVAPIRLLEEALRLDPAFVDAMALLSQAHTWAFLDHAQPADALKSGQALERAQAIDPSRPEVRLARGLRALYVAGNANLAATELAEVVRLRPNSAGAHEALGFALRRQGRMDEALRHFTQSLDLDPLNQLYGEQVQVTLEGLRRYPELHDFLRAATVRFPDDAETQIALRRFEAFQAHDMGPLRAALRDFSGLLTPDQRDSIGIMMAIGERRYLDAINVIHKLPVNDGLWRGEVVGMLYVAAGDSAHAEQTFRAAAAVGRARLQSAPDDSSTLRRLAIVESMLGQHESAFAAIERAREITPEARDAINGPQIAFARSVILVRAGRAAEGYAEAKRLLHVPFGAPQPLYDDNFPIALVLQGDPQYDELINHAPRL